MKHSKKYFVLFTLTVLFGFLAGYLKGAYPEKLMQLSGQKPQHLNLIFSNEQQVPLDLLLDFEKNTGITFTAKVISSYFVFQTEAHNADLIFIPFAWFENALPTLIDSPSLERYSNLLSADFLSLKLSSNQFLPLFWQINNEGELLMWGFAIGKTQNTYSENSFKLISYLAEDSSRMQAWLKKMNMSSSLKMSDSLPTLDDNLKAKKLRDYPLSKISIKRQID